MGDHPGILFSLSCTPFTGEKGYREKSHRCLKYAVEALLVDEGEIDAIVLEHLSFAMDLREGADYGCIYDADSARIVVSSARSVYEMVRE